LASLTLDVPIQVLIQAIRVAAACQFQRFRNSVLGSCKFWSWMWLRGLSGFLMSLMRMGGLNAMHGPLSAPVDG